MTFGAPTELAPIAALALAAALALLPQARVLFTKGSLLSFTSIAAGLAALLSGAYVAFYLRGGPRIIDATSYFLEARALSEGHLAWPVSDPSASTMGRFLVRDSLAHSEHAAVIFPPGYPALLSIGFWLRAPMIIGPILAAVVTFATAFVTSAALPRDLAQKDLVTRVAVALSVVCASLRYHTADTMSHGLSACLVAVAIGCALRIDAAEERSRLDIVALGASLGALVCTRPASGIAACAVAAFVLRKRLGLRGLGEASLAAAPFLSLLAVHQHAATGAWWVSSQSRYYAVSDGPPGCFGYGFGERIGCRFEHGDFVDHYMQRGFGFGELAGTTARRLAMHAIDATNAAPLVLLLALAVLSAARRPGLRVLVWMIGAQIALYAPFYFDGNYPGGGARFFADVLPLEHALLAWFAIEVLSRRVPIATDRLAAISVAGSLAGFAFFAHADHEQLRDREGGRPMFERRLLDAANVRAGLVFVDTDHGFGLAYDPDARASAVTMEIARRRGDALDWILWNQRGQPPAWSYHYDAKTGASAIEPIRPATPTLIEAEHLWPALDQRSASALPLHTPEQCASGGRWLVISTFGADARVRLSLPAALAGARIVPIVATRGAFRASLELLSDGAVAARAPLERPANGATCFEAPGFDLPESGPGHPHALELSIVSDETNPAGLFALDALRIAFPNGIVSEESR